MVSSMERKQTYGHLVFYFTRSGRGVLFNGLRAYHLEKSITAMLSEPLSDDVSQVLALFLQIDPISRRQASTPLAFLWMLEALMNDHSSHTKLLSGVEDEGSDKSFQSAKSEKDSEFIFPEFTFLVKH